MSTQHMKEIGSESRRKSYGRVPMRAKLPTHYTFSSIYV